LTMLDFNAGNYAVFVWPAYGLTALVFLVFIADSLARARRWRKAAEQGERDTQAPDKG